MKAQHLRDFGDFVSSISVSLLSILQILLKSAIGTTNAFFHPPCERESSISFRSKGWIMFKKTILGLVAVASLLVVSAGTASANHRGGFHHGGYHNGGYGFRGGYGGGYRGGYGYAPPIIVAPPVYGYAPAGGYGYGGYAAQPGCGAGYGAAYGYGRPGFGVSTPGFGMYVR